MGGGRRLKSLHFGWGRRLNGSSGGGSANSSGGSSGGEEEEDDNFVTNICTVAACKTEFSAFAECTGTAAEEVQMIEMAENLDCVCVADAVAAACGAAMDTLSADICETACQAAGCAAITACEGYAAYDEHLTPFSA